MEYAKIEDDHKLVEIANQAWIVPPEISLNEAVEMPIRDLEQNGAFRA